MQKTATHRLVWSGIAVLVAALLFSGCGRMTGEQDENLPPKVQFVTVPLDSSQFSHAPVIYWTGNDPDGFVEYYSYADITDIAAIQDPVGFHNHIPAEAWTDTIATQARIFLETQQGRITPHVFYVRCFDNEGAMSDSIVYRTFFRSNRAPNIPRIGLTGWREEDMGTSVYISDTLFCAEEVSETWGGIQITWRADDPDDQSLYKIPLQFQPILVKSPNDTIFVGRWQSGQNITLNDLETGFYTLYVWSRDDAYTLSDAPARIEFNVIRPTFEHDVLLVIEAFNANSQRAFPKLDSLYNEQGTGFYNRLLEDIAPDVGINTAEDGAVRYFPISSAGNQQNFPKVPKALIHQYRLVIYAVDQLYSAVPVRSNYINHRNKVLVEYLRVGGRLWYQGRGLGSFILYSEVEHPELGDISGILMEDFMAVEDINSPQIFSLSSTVYAEFVGTRPALQRYPTLSFDTTMISQNWNEILGDYRGYADSLQWGESGVEAIERGTGAITTQYFDSHTATYTGVVEGEDSEVVSTVELGLETIPYPPTQLKCYIRTEHENVYADSISRVVNATLRNMDPNSNWQGEVITVNNNYVFIGYEMGQPWRNAHTLEVDYKYDPISRFHLRPVEVLHERVEVVDLVFTELRYRTALSTFSYFFMQEEETKEAWTKVLKWFFNPQINL